MPKPKTFRRFAGLTLAATLSFSPEIAAANSPEQLTPSNSSQYIMHVEYGGKVILGCTKVDVETGNAGTATKSYDIPLGLMINSKDSKQKIAIYGYEESKSPEKTVIAAMGGERKEISVPKKFRKKAGKDKIAVNLVRYVLSKNSLGNIKGRVATVRGKTDTAITLSKPESASYIPYIGPALSGVQGENFGVYSGSIQTMSAAKPDDGYKSMPIAEISIKPGDQTGSFTRPISVTVICPTGSTAQ